MRLQENGLFAGWQNVELLAVLMRERARVYEPATKAWMTTVERVPVFSIPMPWLYVYFSRWTLSEAETVQKTPDNVARWQAVILGVQILIAVARWGTYT